jgi:hypothetical protein
MFRKRISLHAPLEAPRRAWHVARAGGSVYCFSWLSGLLICSLLRGRNCILVALLG